ncbi:MAG: ABC transporter permease [Gammaproteobacteria bacterium]
MDIRHLNPLAIVRTLFANHYLLGQLIKRDVLLRYRGAYFGLLWVFLNPLIMLGIFVFVFGYIFQARWPVQYGDIPFAINLYCGLIAFNVFGEAVSRSPAAVRSQPSYVKKIIFPVEILPMVPLGAALVHGVFNFLILIVALLWTGHFSAQIILYPLLLLPLLLLALGASWFLAAWGVFIKDMAQIVPLFVQMLFFLSPILYTASMAPEAVRPLYELNPIGAVIEACRAAVSGATISWVSWGVSLGIGVVAAVLGQAFFQHSRDEFADVL